jgi:hypothetical protein
MIKQTPVIALSFVILMAAVSWAFAGGCNPVSGKTYYSDGVSLFSDSACHQEMTSAGLATASATTISSSGTVNNNCRLVSGHTYYTDGVSLFGDSACHQEMTSADPAAGTTVATAYISTGNGNCRYNSSRMQFTDGVSYFTDNKCQQEALNGQTVSNVSASLAAAATPSTAAGDAQLAQLSARVDTLEQHMVSLQSILVRLLALLSSR